MDREPKLHDALTKEGKDLTNNVSAWDSTTITPPTEEDAKPLNGETRYDEQRKLESRKTPEKYYQTNLVDLYQSPVLSSTRTEQGKIEYGKESGRLHHEEDYSNIQNVLRVHVL